MATNRPNPVSRNGTSTLLSVALVVAVLYFARDIFIPIALAILFSFLLAPLVMRLRRWGWGRLPSVIAVVTLAFVLMAMSFVLLLTINALQGWSARRLVG